jgi:hypothetical protein
MTLSILSEDLEIFNGLVLLLVFGLFLIALYSEMRDNNSSATFNQVEESKRASTRLGGFASSPVPLPIRQRARSRWLKDD